jgi:uncharacterized Zn finger protein
MSLEEKLLSVNTEDLQDLAGEEVYSLGEEYFISGFVELVKLRGNGVTSLVQGSAPQPYHTDVEYVPEEDELYASCTCTSWDGGFCKHAIAVLLRCIDNIRKGEIAHAFLGEDERAKIIRETPELREIRSFLQRQPKEKLVKIVLECAAKSEDMRKDLTGMCHAPGWMHIDTAEYFWEIDQALRGGFVDCTVVPDFVRRLETIADNAEALGYVGHYRESASVLEYLIDKSIEKYEDIDDIDEAYGKFVADLLERYAFALSQYGCDQERLAAWLFKHFENDVYGFGERLLSTFRGALKEEGLRSLEGLARKRLTRLAGTRQRRREKGGGVRPDTDYQYRISKAFLQEVLDLLDEGE